MQSQHSAVDNFNVLIFVSCSGKCFCNYSEFMACKILKCSVENYTIFVEHQGNTFIDPNLKLILDEIFQ